MHRHHCVTVNKEMSNLKATMVYSCTRCQTLLAAVSGFGSHKVRGGIAWGCKVCCAKWDRNSALSCMFTMTYKALTLSFFGPWPLDSLILGAVPELRYMNEGSIIKRTEYHAKANPMCVLRDALLSDDAAERIELSLDTIVELPKLIFKGFLADPAAVCEKKEQIHAKRKTLLRRDPSREGKGDDDSWHLDEG